MRPQVFVDLRGSNESLPLPSPQSPHTPHTPRSPTFINNGDGKYVKCIGDYLLGKKLGRGSFCKVRLATHIQTGAKVSFFIIRFLLFRILMFVVAVCHEDYETNSKEEFMG